MRFYYVGPARGVLHVYTGKILVEGEKVLCGRRMQPGWKWMKSSKRGARKCKGCQK